MVAQKESQIVVPLNEGLVEDVIADIGGGVVTESINTRLTVRKGTLTRRPAITAVGAMGDAGVACGAIVKGPGNSIVAYSKSGIGQARICAGEINSLTSQLDNTQQQNAWYPHQIIDSGDAFTVRSGHPPSVVIDLQGNTWMSAVATSGDTFGIYVTVYNSDGEIIAPQQIVASPTTAKTFPQNLYLWSTITAGPSGIVNLWFANDTGIYALRLTVANSVVSIATGPSLIATPGGGAVFIEAAVSSDGVGDSYVLHRHPTTATSARLTKVNDSTHVVGGTLDFASVVASGGVASFACSAFLISTARHVLVAISHTSAATSVRFRSVNGIAMTQTASANKVVAEFCFVGVQPYVLAGLSSGCVSIARQTSNYPTDNSFVDFVFFDIASGTELGSDRIEWYTTMGNGTRHKVSDTEIYPYFPVTPYWFDSLGGYSPDVGNYVVDPSVELLTPSSVTNMTVVARYGVDRAMPFYVPIGIGNTISCRIGSAQIAATYKIQEHGREGLAYFGSNSAWVLLDMEQAVQPSVAYDDGGSATIAAAYPVVWDGQETIDVTTPHAPRVYAFPVAGSGATLTGSYSFRAVHLWRDKAGNLHRSAPSLPMTVDIVADKPVVYVTVPTIMKNGTTQDSADVVLYMTEPGGSVFYAVQALPDAGYPTGLGYYVFSVIPEEDTSQERLYSTGADNEPLVSTCPPPAWDVETIGSRQWIINAEFRNRLHPSKLKEQGIAFEYAPELAINVDVQYGKLVKVVDIGGRVVVLAERGVWSIGGYGPDNAGQGSGFSDPQLVANTGCKYRHSVAQIPGVGVMFQAEDGRFALLSGGGGIERFERIEAYDVATPLIHVFECEVVYPISTGGFIVYNWLAKGWTRWTDDMGEEEA